MTAVCPGFVDTPALDKGGLDDVPKLPSSDHLREIALHFQPCLYSAERLAQDTVRGIDRNAALVIAPASARVAWRLWRYTPFVANRLVERQLAWTRAMFPAEQAEPAHTSPAPGAAAPAKGSGRDD